MISDKCSTTISLLDSCSATLVSILMAAWLTGYSPVLTIGFKTRITTSGGKTPAMAAAQASAARSTYKNITMFQKSSWNQYKFIKILLIFYELYTYVFFIITMGLKNFQNNEFGKPLEARDQRLLLEHFGEDSKYQGPCGSHFVRKVF